MVMGMSLINDLTARHAFTDQVERVLTNDLLGGFIKHEREKMSDGICHRCGGDHGKAESEQTLATRLCCWRADRPDEWTMDEFIREAKRIDQHIAIYRAHLENGIDVNTDAARRSPQCAEWSNGVAKGFIVALEKLDELVLTSKR